MNKTLIFAILLGFCIHPMMAQKEIQNELFQKRIFSYHHKSLPYRILFPENYDRSKSYPLVIFLHGAGERGDDNQKQLTHGASMFLSDSIRSTFPSIVIFPQCPSKGYWAQIIARENGFTYPSKAAPTEPMQLVIKLIDELIQKEEVDKKRIYVMGLSMGGMGTLDLISRYPKKFAAAIPICGGIHTERLKRLHKLPIRIYHGADDKVVSPEHSKNVFVELKARGSQNATLYIFPNTGHDSWTQAFAQPQFLNWLYSNKQK